MKNAIAGSWVYVIVLIFMVILIAYVAISINYSRAFETSELMIKMLEQNEGFNPTSRKKISEVITGNNATVKHGCGNNEGKRSSDGVFYYGVKGEYVDQNPKKSDYDYCITRTHKDVQGVRKYYYSTTIFFSFSLPVLGDLYAFSIPGETAAIIYIYDDKFDDSF